MVSSGTHFELSDLGPGADTDSSHHLDRSVRYKSLHLINVYGTDSLVHLELLTFGPVEGNADTQQMFLNAFGSKKQKQLIIDTREKTTGAIMTQERNALRNPGITAIQRVRQAQETTASLCTHHLLSTTSRLPKTHSN